MNSEMSFNIKIGTQDYLDIINAALKDLTQKVDTLQNKLNVLQLQQSVLSKDDPQYAVLSGDEALLTESIKQHEDYIKTLVDTVSSLKEVEVDATSVTSIAMSKLSPIFKALGIDIMGTAIESGLDSDQELPLETPIETPTETKAEVPTKESNNQSNLSEGLGDK